MLVIDDIGVLLIDVGYFGDCVEVLVLLNKLGYILGDVCVIVFIYVYIDYLGLVIWFVCEYSMLVYCYVEEVGYVKWEYWENVLVFDVVLCSWWFCVVVWGIYLFCCGGLIGDGILIV